MPNLTAITDKFEKVLKSKQIEKSLAKVLMKRGKRRSSS